MHKPKHTSALLVLFFCALNTICYGQYFDTGKYSIILDTSGTSDQFFRKDPAWRGADGAASVDLENGNVLWLFGDGFICKDSSRSRTASTMIRNSIAVQKGYNIDSSPLTYFWSNLKNKPRDFFYLPGKDWFWIGHGSMIRDKLIVFLMKIHGVKTGLGFEVAGWSAALVDNPHDSPSHWKMKYIDGVETYGLVVGSAAVLKDDKYLYAFGAVEPATHEVYLLRWPIERAYAGKLTNPDWYIEGHWLKRNKKDPVPKPLFIGGTEFSIHYDKQLKKYIQVQSFGFGEASLGLRMADSLGGKWTEPYLFYQPKYPGIKQPFMYAAKAHPEQKGDGLCITYNVNSFDFNEVLSNQSIYFPKTLRIKIVEK
ncbi:DUF4185 domain-containing protein [Flavihumibacter profundi]|uniref:DUF4185 domain-containing protein n=1 Tax=Flavihumibacter profundi TaxID=2716883 RepID=UPI001CC33B4F|nr:DUF4185 domain-containing protein [Flavihumibacter profundi]MBZ5856600.1 DUF4185 domain-containing protein [Flavihumibacter profundi]